MNQEKYHKRLKRMTYIYAFLMIAVVIALISISIVNIITPQTINEQAFLQLSLTPIYTFGLLVAIIQGWSKICKHCSKDQVCQSKECITKNKTKTKPKK